MIMNFTIFLLLFISTFTIYNITTYVDSSALKGMPIYASLLADKGQTAYVSLMENSKNKIKKYDLSTGSLNFVN
jgi:hypothetical protein